jgi:hypothetical protein
MVYDWHHNGDVPSSLGDVNFLRADNSHFMSEQAAWESLMWNADRLKNYIKRSRQSPSPTMSSDGPIAYRVCKKLTPSYFSLKKTKNK